MLEHTRKANVRSAADHTSTLEINEGQARMTIQRRRTSTNDNPKTQATLGTRTKTNKTHTKKPQKRNLKDDQHERHEQTGLNPCEGKAVPVCYKTPTVLLIMKSVNSRT